MKRFDRLLVNVIDKMYFLEKRILPRMVVKRLYRYVCQVFEEEAVDCYLADRQDIGFFENFILGSELSRKISEEIEDSIHEDSKSQAWMRSYGFRQEEEVRHKEMAELMYERILEKKKRVVELLRKKGELIRYLGRRIVTRNEMLYQKLERIYNRLYAEMQEILGGRQDEHDLP
jgi:hypothetical protein